MYYGFNICRNGIPNSQVLSPDRLWCEREVARINEDRGETEGRDYADREISEYQGELLVPGPQFVNDDEDWPPATSRPWALLASCGCRVSPRVTEAATKKEAIALAIANLRERPMICRKCGRAVDKIV